MKDIQCIKQFEFDEPPQVSKDIEVGEIFSAEAMRLVEVRLRAGAILPKHKANEPITVLCIAGEGRFSAGENLENELHLLPGTLLAVDAGVEHEVSAKTPLHLLITKFKNSV